MKVFFKNFFDLGHQRGIDICTKLCSSKIKLIAKEFVFQILHLKYYKKKHKLDFLTIATILLFTYIILEKKILNHYCLVI